VRKVDESPTRRGSSSHLQKGSAGEGGQPRGRSWELVDRSLDLPLPEALRPWEQTDNHYGPQQAVSCLSSPGILPRARPLTWSVRTEPEKGVYMFAWIMYSRGDS
jgi:hypothetical protein